MVDSINPDSSDTHRGRGPLVDYEIVRDIVADWRDAHDSTQPADRDRAEAGAKAAYAAAGLPEPNRFLWVDSPKAGLVVARVFRGRTSWESVGELRTSEVHDDVVQAFQDSFRDWMPLNNQTQIVRGVGLIESHLGHHGDVRWPGDARALGNLIEDELGLSAWNQVATQINELKFGRKHPRGHAEAMARSAMGTAACREMLAPPAFGQFSAANLAYVSALGVLAGVDVSPLTGIFEVARSAGPWWPFDKTVILTERPTVRHVDLSGNLHCSTGAALGYADGFGAWCWRRVSVPPDLILGRWRLEDVIAEKASKIRRCAIERLGWDLVDQAGLSQVGETVPDPGDPEHLVSLFKVPRRYFERRRGYFDDAWDEPNTIRLLLCSSIGDGKPCHDGVTVPAKFVDAEAAVKWARVRGLMTLR